MAVSRSAIAYLVIGPPRILLQQVFELIVKGGIAPCAGCRCTYESTTGICTTKSTTR